MDSSLKWHAFIIVIQSLAVLMDEKRETLYIDYSYAVSCCLVDRLIAAEVSAKAEFLIFRTCFPRSLNVTPGYINNASSSRSLFPKKNSQR